MIRKIIHIDMDCFYAAIEMRDRPQIRNQPVVVGGDHTSRGVVCTANYLARSYGIHSAMPSAQAYKLCPFAVFIKPRFEVYRAVSQQIMDILASYSAQMEPISLDEAYLDVTDNPLHQNSATRIAREIKQRILQTTQITASAGVSYNKFLAKIASDLQKPDGLSVIPPAQGALFIQSLPIEKFHGVGKMTAQKMKSLGIYTGEDLLRWSEEALIERFGKTGSWYYTLAQGADLRQVNGLRMRKSIGHEETFEEDLQSVDAMVACLQEMAQKVAEHLQQKQLCAHTMSIKVKFSDFSQVTRSMTLLHPFDQYAEFASYLSILLRRTAASQQPVRLLGVSASGLQPKSSFLEAVQTEILF